MRLRFLLVFLLLLPLCGMAHDDHEDKYEGSTLKFIANKGQWVDDIVFRGSVPSGKLFLLRDRLVFDFMHEEDVSRLHDIHHGTIEPRGPKDFEIRKHAYAVRFLGANFTTPHGENKTADYSNYLLGNDSRKWAAEVPGYRETVYHNVYAGIDFHLYGKGAGAKYDFVVAAGVDPSVIALSYEGVDRLYLKKGALHLETSVNELIEEKPIAYQNTPEGRKYVPCQFQLYKRELRFEFPEGYDESLELVIDPSLVFSTYTGSNADNWGYTATYDLAGNLYAGGIVFNDNGNSYPTTTGAYQTTFQGGEGATQVDIVITKFASDGSSLVYSTYLGGGGNESPHSLVVDHLNQLTVLGSTSSNNFPTSPLGFDKNFGGGTSQTLNGIPYTSGSDIIVTKLNALGSGLVGSTYVGGSADDGVQQIGGTLVYSYGDPFRGEVIVDTLGNVYVASVTASSIGFPTNGGFQSNYGGGAHDGVVFKLNPTLTTMVWSSYLGGSGDDAAYSLQLNSVGEVCVTGGTSSQNFPVSATALHGSNQGSGISSLVDGFATIVTAAGNSLSASTYLGTAEYDQSYFIQVDSADDVYVVGQTEGNYPVTGNVYSNPNSGQFLQKMDDKLSISLASTVFGTGSGDVDLVLTAFLVNNCHNVFISGWGGTLSGQNNPGSTTNGLPWTPNAYSTTTDGNDFYFMVLSPDFQDFLFGTYLGGNGSNEHVDGGTCRFDKQGIVYHAVCAGCGGTSLYPTTANAYSQTNNSPNCNLAAFKYDLATLDAVAETDGPSSVCLDDSVHFLNLSVGGAYWLWNFGDGNTSTEFEPGHKYANAGTYNVFLSILDSVSCTFSDTAFLSVNINPYPTADVTPITSSCLGDSVQLQANGGTSYFWFPAQGLSNPLIANPKASPDETTTYSVVVTDSCGSDTTTITVTIKDYNIGSSPDDQICVGQSVGIWASGGHTYQWSPSVGLNSDTISNPMASPTQTTTYTAIITDTSTNCTYQRDVTIFVDTNNVIDPSTRADTTICLGDSAILAASGATFYRWSPAGTIENRDRQKTFARPKESTKYYVDISNVCGTVRDSMTVFVQKVEPNVSSDTTLCPGKQTQLRAEGGIIYRWSPAVYVSDYRDPSPIAFPKEPTTFAVEVIDALNCRAVERVRVDYFSRPQIYAGPDVFLAGDSVVLEATGKGKINWSPSNGLSCTSCNPVVARPERTTTYYAQLTDSNGCKRTDSLVVEVISNLYIPNTFSPNGRAPNDIFKAEGIHILKYKMKIYNRWGEHIFTTNSLDEGWDGTINGRQAPIGTYIYQVWYTIISGRERSQTGHVNIIR